MVQVRAPSPVSPVPQRCHPSWSQSAFPRLLPSTLNMHKCPCPKANSPVSLFSLPRGCFTSVNSKLVTGRVVGSFPSWGDCGGFAWMPLSRHSAPTDGCPVLPGDKAAFGFKHIETRMCVCGVHKIIAPYVLENFLILVLPLLVCRISILCLFCYGSCTLSPGTFYLLNRIH